MESSWPLFTLILFSYSSGDAQIFRHGPDGVRLGAVSATVNEKVQNCLLFGKKCYKTFLKKI